MILSELDVYKRHDIEYTEGKGIRVGIAGVEGKSSVLMVVDSVTKNKKTGKTKLVLVSDRYYNGMTCLLYTSRCV